MGKFRQQAMVVIIACVPFFSSFSQTGTDSSLVKLHSWFDKAVGVENNGLYNGPIYLMVAKSRTTHQFFDSRLWHTGNLSLADDHYFNVKMMYDIHSDQLILKHPDITRRDGISVDMNKLTAFNLGPSDFVKVNLGNKGTFYQILYAGSNFDLLCRRKKVESITTQGAIFESQNQVFLSADGQLTPIRKKSDVLKVYPNHEDDLKSITRDYGIRFRLKNESQLTAFISKFDQVIE